jgi:tetratricopeptide (TPR) repeat protein
MDTIQDLKRRASTLEAKGDDSGALKVYSSIPADQMEAGLLGRMAAVQARVGKVREAVQSQQRSAARLLQDGFRNAAIHAYRRVVDLDPRNAEALLRLGQLSAEAGYRRDAAEAFSSYLAGAGDDPLLDDFFEAVAAIPEAHRAAVVEPLRHELLARDPAHAPRIEQLLDGAATAPSEPAREISRLEDPLDDLGLTPSGLSGSGPEPEIAPVTGLETHGSDADDLPPLLGDLPMLQSALEDEETDEPEPASTIPPLDTFEAEAALVEVEGRGVEPEPEIENEGGKESVEEFVEETAGESEGDAESGEDLPLLAMETESASHDASEAVAPATADRTPEPADDWIDLGAMVREDEEDGASGGLAGEHAAGARIADEAVTDLLRELGAQPVDDSGDVGSRYDLGLAYKEMGLLDAAIAQLHGALAEGDNPLASLEVLGECYLERGEQGKAYRVLEHATGIGSASDLDLLGVRYLLGRCEEAMGEVEAARESFTRVVSIEPSFRDAAARLREL